MSEEDFMARCMHACMPREQRKPSLRKRRKRNNKRNISEDSTCTWTKLNSTCFYIPAFFGKLSILARALHSWHGLPDTQNDENTLRGVLFSSKLI